MIAQENIYGQLFKKKYIYDHFYLTVLYMSTYECHGLDFQSSGVGYIDRFLDIDLR